MRLEDLTEEQHKEYDHNKNLGYYACEAARLAGVFNNMTDDQIREFNRLADSITEKNSEYLESSCAYEEYKESFFSDYYDTVEKLNTLSKGKDMITPIFNAIKEANNHE